MAEGGLRKLLENEGHTDINVSSAGTAAATGFPATAYAVEAARIWEAEITRHNSRPITPALIREADLIIGMTSNHCRDVIGMMPEAKGKTFLLKNFPQKGCDGEGVDDPIGGSLDMYNQTFLEIGEELGRILPEIIKLAQNKP